MNKIIRIIGLALALYLALFVKDAASASVIQVDSELISFIESEYKGRQASHTKQLLDSLKHAKWERNDDDAWISENLTLKPIDIFRGKKGTFFFFKSQWTKVVNNKIVQYEDCIWIEKVGGKFAIIRRLSIFN